MATRTPEEIRASIEQNRQELGHSLEKLRREVGVLTDWRGHAVVDVDAGARGLEADPAVFSGRGLGRLRAVLCSQGTPNFSSRRSTYLRLHVC